MKEGRGVKKSIAILTVVVLGTVFAIGSALAAGHFEALAKNELAPIGHNKYIVKYTKEKNSQGETMEEINRIDTLWKAEEGVADYMKPYLEGPCARYLKEVRSLVPYIQEIFVMDNQGALVCETDKTGDYMQGDEDKWIKSFADGKGGIFVDEPEDNVVQISVPVMDNGMAIGAITFGVFTDKVK